MTKFILFFITIIIIAGCQKEISDFAANNPQPGDSTEQFIVKTIWEYYYDIPGAVADSFRTDYDYDTAAKTMSYKSVFWNSIFNQFDSVKRIHHYNSLGDWTEEDEFGINLTAIAWTNRFIRNAAGQPLEFNYTRDNYGIQENYTAYFQQQMLPGGIQRIKVVDTVYDDYPRTGYYQVDVDAGGLVRRMEFLPWSQSGRSVLHFFYTPEGQMEKVVDSSMTVTGDGYVITTNYVQEISTNKVLESFIKNLKGRNFWWYMQDKYYNFNLFYDDYYVGVPLKEFTEKAEQFQAGIRVNQTENKYVLQNKFDTNKNLLESTLVFEGEVIERKRFAYK